MKLGLRNMLVRRQSIAMAIVSREKYTGELTGEKATPSSWLPVSIFGRGLFDVQNQRRLSQRLPFEPEAKLLPEGVPH